MITKNIFDNNRNFHGAKGIVFINKKMLVYRRDNKTDSFPLYIDLPGGGRETKSKKCLLLPARRLLLRILLHVG